MKMTQKLIAALFLMTTAISAGYAYPECTGEYVGRCTTIVKNQDPSSLTMHCSYDNGREDAWYNRYFQAKGKISASVGDYTKPCEFPGHIQPTVK